MWFISRSAFIYQMETRFQPRIPKEKDILRSHMVSLMDQNDLYRLSEGRITKMNLSKVKNDPFGEIYELHIFIKHGVAS